MALTAAQLQTLKSDIAANAATIPAGQPWTGAFAGVAVKNVPNSGDGNAAVAGWYNQSAAPAFTAWKVNVSLGDVGKTFNAAELAGLTSLNTQRLQNLAAWLEAGVNPALATIRQFFDDVFSGAGGVNTRASLLVLWKRFATYAQRLFAAGTGSDASPAVLATNTGDAFVLTAADVNTALNLP